MKLARRRGGVVPLRRVRASGLSPSAPRSSRRLEAQRLEGIGLVTERADRIRALAVRYGIAVEAIAGAVLWDAIENPYRRRVLRLGPGKVHPLEPRGPSEAELVERDGLVPRFGGGSWRRLRRLRDADTALLYVAAILARHARVYARVAGVEISGDAAILCTLYQGGGSERRAAQLRLRRLADPLAMPVAADEMGPWVRTNLGFIRDLLDRGATAGPVPGPDRERIPVPAPMALH